MEGLTPASADDLLQLGKLIVDEPFWRHPAWAWPGKVLRVCVSGRPADPPGYVAAVTETGLGNSVTECAGRIWAGLVRMYGPSLVLLEHHPAPELAEGAETLDLDRMALVGHPQRRAVLRDAWGDAV